jgi:hypothetical protein
MNGLWPENTAMDSHFYSIRPGWVPVSSLPLEALGSIIELLIHLWMFCFHVSEGNFLSSANPQVNLMSG